MVLNAILLALAAMVLFLLAMGVVFLAIKIHQNQLEAEDGALDILRNINGPGAERSVLDLQNAAAQARAGSPESAQGQAGESELEKQTGAGRGSQDAGSGGVGGGAREDFIRSA